jgi:putative flippase GtrA
VKKFFLVAMLSAFATQAAVSRAAILAVPQKPALLLGAAWSPIAIAISFANNQVWFWRSRIQRRLIWPVRLLLVTALMELPYIAGAGPGL